MSALSLLFVVIAAMAFTLNNSKKTTFVSTRQYLDLIKLSTTNSEQDTINNTNLDNNNKHDDRNINNNSNDNNDKKNNNNDNYDIIIICFYLLSTSI